MKIAVFSLICLSVATLASAQTDYTIETFTVPDAIYTETSQLNDSGYVVGFFARHSENGYGSELGYVRSPAGDFTVLAPPGAVLSSFATGINNSNRIVGSFNTNVGATSAFSYQSGVYHSFTVDGSFAQFLAINSQLALLGKCCDNGGSFLRTPNGEFHLISYPIVSTQTDALGINDLGDIVGSYFYIDASFQHGFLLSGEQYSTLDFPGATSTFPSAINNSGEIAGYYNVNFSFDEGFIWKSGVFKKFAIDGAKSTYVTGINNRGQLAGFYYTNEDPNFVAFIATPTPK